MSLLLLLQLPKKLFEWNFTKMYAVCLFAIAVSVSIESIGEMLVSQQHRIQRIQ